MKTIVFSSLGMALLAACSYSSKNVDNSITDDSSTDKVFEFSCNPLIRDKFTADPAPMVYKDTLYLYVGHDEYYDGQDSANGGKEFNITEWLCYSTSDMIKWTDHGAVLRPADFTWADTIGPGVGTAWAAQVVERNGKFYYYVTTQGSGDTSGYAIGVAVANTPTGPFVDAIGAPLITDKMTDNGKRGWWNDIDPTVLVDGDEAWLCWGNGTCFLAPLNPDMISLAGEIETLPMEKYAEGPWLHRRGDTYYLTYASWGEGREAIDYATAPSPHGPWTHQGQLTGMAENSFTIHPGIINFKDQDYLFYHNATLEIDSIKGAIGRRSVCVDSLFYAPDGKMLFVEQSKCN